MTKAEWFEINGKYRIAKLLDSCSNEEMYCKNCPFEAPCLYYFTGDDSLFEKPIDNAPAV